jgi:hypothetical protein
VTRLRTETFEKSGVAQELVLQDFDGDVSANDGVGGLPHFAHAAHGYPRLELVAPAEVHAS